MNLTKGGGISGIVWPPRSMTTTKYRITNYEIHPGQKDRHRKISFRDEFVQFLKANENRIQREILVSVDYRPLRGRPFLFNDGILRFLRSTPGFMLSPAPQAD